MKLKVPLPRDSDGRWKSGMQCQETWLLTARGVCALLEKPWVARTLVPTNPVYYERRSHAQPVIERLQAWALKQSGVPLPKGESRLCTHAKKVHA